MPVRIEDHLAISCRRRASITTAKSTCSRERSLTGHVPGVPERQELAEAV
jgi:hypothetical protein